jgi:hypothetical protein
LVENSNSELDNSPELNIMAAKINSIRKNTSSLPSKMADWDFDVFKFSERIGRQNTLVFCVDEILRSLPSGTNRRFGDLDEKKFLTFGRKISRRYDSTV